MLVVLVLAVGGGIWWSHEQALRAALPGASATAQEKGLTLGAVGSEKIAYFSDSRVRGALDKHGFRLRVDKAGSREIASLSNLKSYDFAFPAGEPATVEIQDTIGRSKFSVPIYTVMTVTSWKPIAKIPKAKGLVRKEGEFWYILDLRDLLQLSVAGKR